MRSVGLSNQKWNVGTWVGLMLILLAGSYASYYFKNYTDSLLLYLPTSLGFVMIHWFGPRILPLAFLNSFVTLYLWNAPGDWSRIVLIATREPVIVFASWYFCKNLIYYSRGLSNTKVFATYVLLGIVVPDLINSLYTYHYTFINGNMGKVAVLWISDFITVFTISVPLLHYFYPVRTKYFFRLEFNEPKSFENLNKRALIEIALITILFLGLGFFINFDKYWFVYGVFAAYIAGLYGFCYVIFINAIIFIFNYVLPLINFGALEYGVHNKTQLLNVHLGMGSMFLGTALIGRVISDLRNSETALIEQKKQIELANNQLRKTNQELDRFVYSVSHDINAPLKSIRGLIAISKLESPGNNGFPYISKIEESVRKLEDFADEILEHSRASRKEIVIQEVNVQQLIDEILDNLRYMDGFKEMKFSVQYNSTEIKTDRFLLKVILTNLISNAIKFQNRRGETPHVKITTRVLDDIFIEVEDNGEGIQDEFKERIFEMFYRATTTANGSGLGLFIARETAEKLNGSLSFKTKYGEGSTFTISLPIMDEIQLPAQV